MKMTFQIALVQFKPIRKNVNANIQKIQSILSGLTADLIVLPELANSGYLYEDPSELKPYSEPGDGSGDFLSSLIDLSKSTGGMIIAGYAEADGDHIFNSAAAVSAAGLVENYQKTHLYADEKSLFQPGQTGFKVTEWLGVKIGMMICFDWIFPESARTLTSRGAQIIAHPANLVMPYCQNAMITRSIENRVFTITANRIGSEHLNQTRLLFTGASQMTNPSGEILYRGPTNAETVHIATIDPNEAHNKRISARNDLFEDRRPKMYQMD